MTRKVTLTFLLTGLAIAVYSQNLKTISGKVHAENQADFYGYSIVLLTPQDSSFIKGDFFTEETFSIKAERQPLLLKISSFGYRDTTLLVTAGDENIFPIYLYTQAVNLDEVVVKAQMPVFTPKDDRITMNVGSTMLSQSGTAEDVLRKSARVSVNRDVVSVIGRGEAIVLVDGHRLPTNKSLSSISSAEIQKIDIITSPSSKYDAEGKAVIEITTKRANRQFWGAELTSRLGKGNYWRGYTGVELSAKFSGLSLYGYYAFEPSKETLKESYIRDYTKTEQPKYITNDAKTTEKPISNNYRFSGEYRITDRHNAGLQLNGQYKNSKININNISNIFDENLSLIDLISSFRQGEQHKQYTSITGFYDYTSSSGKVKWNSLIDESLYDTQRNLIITENISGNSSAKSSEEKVAIDILSIKSDASIELPKDFKLDVGTKLTFSRNDSHTKLLSGTTLDKYVPYFYTEKIAALYLLAGKRIKKWDFEAGLRFEAAGLFAETDAVIQDTVKLNLFPSASVKYTINDKWTVTSKYAMRITRPTFQELNPAITYIDTLSYTQGNPHLLPEIQNSIEVKLSFMDYASLGISYTRKNNAYSWCLTQDPNNPNVTMATEKNIKRSDVYTVDLMLPYRNKMLTAYLATGMIYTVSNDKSFDVISLKGPMWYLYSGIDMEFPYKIKLNSNIGYYTKGVNNIYTVEPMFRMDAGLQRNFCKDKLSVSLLWNDIFRSATMKSYATMNDRYIHYSSYTDQSYIQLSVQYKFNLQKSQFNSRSSLGKEIDRIKDFELEE